MRKELMNKKQNLKNEILQLEKRIADLRREIDDIDCQLLIADYNSLLLEISCCMKGYRPRHSSKESAFAKKVADFALNVLFNYAQENKIFRDRLEFDAYGGYRNLSFFGKNIQIKRVDENDAMIIFNHYKASRMIDVIHEHEKMFRKTIVVDYKRLEKCLYQMFSNNNISFLALEGVNANYSLIAPEEFEKEIEQIDKYE